MTPKIQTDVETNQPTETWKPFILGIAGFAIIGSYAAGMLGLRSSKFAFGKDLYRAWEAHEKARGRGPENIFSNQSNAEDIHWKEKTEQARRNEQADRERRQRAEFHFRMEEAMKEHIKRSFDRAYGRRTSNHFGVDEEEIRRRIFEDILKKAQEYMKKEAYRTNQSRNSDFQSFDAWFRSFEGNRFQGYTRGYFYEKAKQQQQQQNEPQKNETSSVHASECYKQLELPMNASLDQVKEAYRKAARTWHPDTYQGSDPQLAATRFRQVTEAYEYLTNSNRHSLRK
eukprot:jgi/Galph1/5347/GphlegSOOS_G3923.1